MNRIKLLLTVMYALALTIVPSAMLLSASPAFAQNSEIQESLCSGANLEAPTSTPATACEADNGTGVNGIVNTVITVFSWVVGVVSVIMIIVGGFKYVTSGGESSGVTSAKNTILYAIVGLIIVAIAQVVVKFVLSNVNK
jgi:hypothetical protein